MLFRYLKLLTVAAWAIANLSAEEEALEKGFVPLFDGKTLQGWSAAHSTGPGDTGAFSVNKKEKAIHVYAGQEAGSKQKSDCLNTDVEFSHYILKLEYKWLDKKYEPRATWDRDAGLLFHVHGDTKKVWPWSLEMQIGESPAEKKGKKFHTGDLFVLGRHLRATTTKKSKYYDAAGESAEGGSVPTLLGAEKPHGEWNEMEIHVYGAEKATFIFNGEIVHQVTDMKQQIIKGGEFVPLTKGRIGLQAEWAEILYRNIRIKELPSE